MSTTPIRLPSRRTSRVELRRLTTAGPPSGEGHEKYETWIDVNGAQFINLGTTTTASWTQLSVGLAAADPSGTSAGYQYINTTTGRLMKNVGGTFYDTYVDVVGDSGSGGTAGLVPAPAAGDAAANKYLKADGTWDDIDFADVGTFTHASTHTDGTDDIANFVADNGTDAVGVHGLVPPSAIGDATANKVLLATGAWGNVDYTDLDSVPSTFAPSAHASGHTDGTDDIANFTADNGTDTAGVKGLVPPSAIGDATANKVLLATGAWGNVDYTDLDSVPSTFAPTAHASDHTDGTDDVADFTPDNNSDTAGVHGLVPASAIGDATLMKVLTADGNWTAPLGIVADMVGDSGSGGTHGLVPAPGTGDALKFLRGDGVWTAGDPLAPHGSNHTDGTDDVADFVADNGSDTAGVHGLVPASAIGDAAALKFLKATGAWAAVTLTDIGITKPSVSAGAAVGDLITALGNAGYITVT